MRFTSYIEFDNREKRKIKTSHIKVCKLLPISKASQNKLFKGNYSRDRKKEILEILEG